MATFTWNPSYNASVDKEPSVKTAKFGDGYEQRQPNGINTIKDVWSLTFENRDQSEITAIDTFLTARAGVEAFDWTPPRGSAGKYVCRRWTRSIPYSIVDSLSCVFERAYES